MINYWNLKSFLNIFQQINGFVDNSFFIAKNILFFWLPKNKLYIRIDLIKDPNKCQITVFILAILIISFLGNKDCLWLFENKKQIKLIYNPDENQDFFLSRNENSK